MFQSTLCGLQELISEINTLLTDWNRDGKLITEVLIQPISENAIFWSYSYISNDKEAEMVTER